MMGVESEGKVTLFEKIYMQSIVLFWFWVFLPVLCSLWDLSSLTRDRTWALGSETMES